MLAQRAAAVSWLLVSSACFHLSPFSIIHPNLLELCLFQEALLIYSGPGILSQFTASEPPTHIFALTTHTLMASWASLSIRCCGYRTSLTLAFKGVGGRESEARHTWLIHNACLRARKKWGVLS